MSRLAQNMPLVPRQPFCPGHQLGLVVALVLAPERLPHEAGAVLQQIGADLAAGAREGVEGVEVYVVG